jgi:hypothetical protein
MADIVEAVADEWKLDILGDLMNAKLDHDIDQVIAPHDLARVIEQPSLGVHRTGHPEIPSLELFARHFPDHQWLVDARFRTLRTSCRFRYWADRLEL